MNCDLIPIFAYSKKWVFKENYQPITIYQGMPANIELTHRRQAIEYIYKLQEILGKYGQLIPNVNVLVSAVYLQRFYYIHSFYSVDPKQLAAASLFLACKANDPWVQIERLARAYWELNFPNTPRLPTAKLDDVTHIIAELENALLLTLDVRDLQRLSYDFATDVICQTDWILRYTKEEIAAACIFSISSWMNFKIPVNEWWRQFVPMLEEDALIEMTNNFYELCATKCKYKLKILKHDFLCMRKLPTRTVMLPLKSQTHNDKPALFNQTHASNSFSSTSLLGGYCVSSEVIADYEKTSESNSDTDDLTSSAHAPPLSPSDDSFVSVMSDDDDGIVPKKPRL